MNPPFAGRDVVPGATVGLPASRAAPYPRKMEIRSEAVQYAASIGSITVGMESVPGICCAYSRDHLRRTISDDAPTGFTTAHNA